MIRGFKVICMGLGLLAQMTGAAEVAPVTLFNAGFPGRNSAQAVARLQQDVLVHAPQHVVLYFGMNDAMNSQNLCPLETYARNMATLTQRLQTNRVRTVVLVTCNPIIEAYVAARHPRHPQRQALQAHLERYNARIRQLAQQYQLPCVDLHARVAALGGATIASNALLRCEANCGAKDGVHLTRAGYAVLGTAVAEALRPHVRAGDRIVCYGDSLTFGVHVKGAGSTEGETYPAVVKQRLLQPRNTTP